MNRRRIKRLIIVFASVLLSLNVKIIIFYYFFFSGSHLDDPADRNPCSADCRSVQTPCLHRLTPPENLHRKSNHSLEDLLRHQTIQEIHRIPGNVDPVLYHVLPILSHIQWSNDIYGSAAEFGVGVGKFTSLLAQNIDSEVGERLLVVDSFRQALNRQISMNGRLSQHDIFAANLHQIGFDEKATGPKRMYIHRGSAEDLRLSKLKKWQLPLFRFVSVNLEFGNASLSKVLDLAECLLTDGGMIILGVADKNRTSTESQQQVILSELEELYQEDDTRRLELSPVFVAGGKMFLASSQWTERFRERMKEEAQRMHLRLSEVNISNNFGSSRFLRIFY